MQLFSSYIYIQYIYARPVYSREGGLAGWEIEQVERPKRNTRNDTAEKEYCINKKKRSTHRFLLIFILFVFSATIFHFLFVLCTCTAFCTGNVLIFFFVQILFWCVNCRRISCVHYIICLVKKRSLFIYIYKFSLFVLTNSFQLLSWSGVNVRLCCLFLRFSLVSVNSVDGLTTEGVGGGP